MYMMCQCVYCVFIVILARIDEVYMGNVLLYHLCTCVHVLMVILAQIDEVYIGNTLYHDNYRLCTCVHVLMVDPCSD